MTLLFVLLNFLPLLLLWFTRSSCKMFQPFKLMLLPSFVSSANFIGACWHSEPRLWEKILTKVSLGSSPGEGASVAPTLLPTAWGPIPLARVLPIQPSPSPGKLIPFLAAFLEPREERFIPNLLSRKSDNRFDENNLPCGEPVWHLTASKSMPSDVCSPPLKHTRKTCYKKMSPEGSQLDTCVFFTWEEQPSISFSPPTCLCSGWWLWLGSCATTAFPTEVHPAAAHITASPSFTMDFSCSCLIIHLHPWLDGHAWNRYWNAQNHNSSNACMKLCCAGTCTDRSRTVFPSLLRVF